MDMMDISTLTCRNLCLFELAVLKYVVNIIWSTTSTDNDNNHSLALIAHKVDQLVGSSPEDAILGLTNGCF